MLWLLYPEINLGGKLSPDFQSESLRVVVCASISLSIAKAMNVQLIYASFTEQKETEQESEIVSIDFHFTKCQGIPAMRLNVQISARH